MTLHADILSTYWLPVCASKQLKGKPLAVSLLGHDLVVYRPENGIAALRDRCPHRNVPLSAGRVTGSCIQCPYHGWKFDPYGACVELPGAPPGQDIPYKTRAYEVREAGGLVWILLQRGENSTGAPELPPHLDQDVFHTRLWRSSARGTLLNTLENFLDGTHTHYVHAGVLRSEKQRAAIQAETAFSEGAVTIIYKNEPRQSGLIARLFEPERSESRARFSLPCIATLVYTDAKGVYFAVSAYIVPEAGESLKIFAFISHRKSLIPGWIKHALVLPFFKLVLNQDREILDKQRECIARSGGEHFIVSPQDLIRPHLQSLLNGVDVSGKETISTTIYL